MTPLQGCEFYGRPVAQGFTLGYHIAAFQACAERRRLGNPRLCDEIPLGFFSRNSEMIDAESIHLHRTEEKTGNHRKEYLLNSTILPMVRAG